MDKQVISVETPVYELIGIPMAEKRPLRDAALTGAIKKYFKSFENRLPRSKSVPKLSIEFTLFDSNDSSDDEDAQPFSLRYTRPFYIPSDYYTGWTIINLKNCGNVPKGLFTTKSENNLDKAE